MYQLTKEGEKNVSEFVEECRKRYKKISEYYRALSGHYTDCVDHVELPTREIILHEINSGERFLEDVWCVGDKYYMSDWCLSKKHNIYVSLELKYGTDFIRIRKEISRDLLKDYGFFLLTGYESHSSILVKEIGAA